MNAVRNVLKEQVKLREAAAVILVAPKKISTGYVHEDDPVQRILQKVTSTSSNHLDSKRDFVVLLVKRSNNSRVMPNTYVFPGGTYSHDEDSARSWADSYRQAYSLGQLSTMEFHRHLLQWEKWPEPRPPLFRKYHMDSRLGDSSSKSEDMKVRAGMQQSAAFLPAELGFRICALRELFEETGIMLARGRDEALDRLTSSSYESSTGPNKLLGYQRSTSGDQVFEAAMDDLNLFPSVSYIHEWANWTAPTMLPLNKRFDTMFYITVVAHRPPINLIENGEVDDSMWADPEEALRLASNSEIVLAPPQIYELGRLARFTKLEELKRFAFRRAELGCQQFFPHVVKTADDKVVTILPGDDAYPSKMDMQGDKIDVPKLDKSADQLRKSCRHLHRVEFASGTVGSWRNFAFHMNISPAAGHVSPVDHFGSV